MGRIIVIPRANRELGWELGDCMACLANAGIRDYTACLDGCILFQVADQISARAIKVLVDAGFNAVTGVGMDVPADST